MRDERLEQLAVARLGTPAHEAEHARLARTVDIGVEQADLRALGFQRQREIDGHGRLADAALSRRDGDQVVCAGQRLQAVLDGVRGDRALDRHLELRPLERRGAVHAQRFGERLTARGERVADSNLDVPRGAAALELERRAGTPERPAGLGNDEAAESFGEARAGGIRHDAATWSWAAIVT